MSDAAKWPVGVSVCSVLINEAVSDVQKETWTSKVACPRQSRSIWCLRVSPKETSKLGMRAEGMAAVTGKSKQHP